MWFLRQYRQKLGHNGTPSPEVAKIKQQTHQSVSEADNKIRKLNDLLEANGITLRIHAAVQEHRHGR